MDKNKIGNLNNFVNAIANDNEQQIKDLCNYKRIHTIINIYNSMVAYKNITGDGNLIVPSMSTDTNDKLSLSFEMNSIVDFKGFSSCIEKYCASGVSITNLGNKSVIVKV